MLLRQTQEVFTELAANSTMGLGEHLQDHLAAAAVGMPVGEIEYDPELHDPSDILSDSMMTAATGLPYVEQTIPVKPLEIQVITDLTDNSDHPAITEAKIAVVNALTTAIDGSVPNPADRVFSYYFGNVPTSIGIDTLDTVSDVVQLCKQGLTYVISDFNLLGELMAREVGAGELSKTVAVKTNHELSLEIPRGIGVVTLGGALELNTNDAEALRAANKRLDVYHCKLVEKLRFMGTAVAQVVVNQRHLSGFDVNSTDSAIAKATKSLW